MKLPKTFHICWEILFKQNINTHCVKSACIWSFSGPYFSCRTLFTQWNFFSNKAKGRISKLAFQENKARQVFRKWRFLNPWYAHVRTCTYQWVRNVRFLEHLACFVFLKRPFWGSPFCLITGDLDVLLDFAYAFEAAFGTEIRKTCFIKNSVSLKTI